MFLCVLVWVCCMMVLMVSSIVSLFSMRGCVIGFMCCMRVLRCCVGVVNCFGCYVSNLYSISVIMDSNLLVRFWFLCV